MAAVLFVLGVFSLAAYVCVGVVIGFIATRALRTYVGSLGLWLSIAGGVWAGLTWPLVVVVVAAGLLLWIVRGGRLR